MRRPGAIPFFILALAGFADSLYLALEHYFGLTVSCGQTWLVDCGAVLGSRYAAVGGVPVAVAGSIFYLIALIGIIAYIDRGSGRVQTALRWWATGGLVATVWFLYAQIVLIGALCPYCLVSALTSTGLAAIAWISWRRAPSGSGILQETITQR